MKLSCCLLPVTFLLMMAELSNASSRKPMSIDKQILDAAPDAHMFDVFHVMPEGDVKVMTELDLLLTLDQYRRLRGAPTSRTASAPGGEEGEDEDDDDSDGTSRIIVSRGRRGRGRRNRNSRRQKRKADQDVALLWPGCLVYWEVDETFTSEDLETLKAAMEEWKKFTCLAFIESSTATSRLQFKNGGGCYSQLGRQTTPQIVALAPTCRTKGIIAHEIGHAIGWYHEHMRPDRDSYISVNFNAIPMRYHVNFEKYESSVINTHGVDYDYTSLMHYGNDALPGSITALDPTYQDKMGQREGLTFKDIKLANIMYSCADAMGCPDVPDEQNACPFGGFRLYKSYKGKSRCSCWCDSRDLSDPLVLCSEIDSEPPKPVVRPTETPVVDLCYDVRDECSDLKAQGHCMSKLALMMDICKKSCGFCGTDGGVPPEPPCMDHDKGCPMMAATGLCTTLEPVMERQCPASCNLCPSPPDPCEVQKTVMTMFHLSSPINGAPHTAAISLLTATLSLIAVLLRLW